MRFNSKRLSDTRWDVEKYGGDFDQFSGATITPRALVKSVAKTLETLNERQEAANETGEIAAQGVWSNNPAMVQMLGLCPLLAVSNTVINSLVLGLLTIAVLVCANTLISLIRNTLNDTTRLPTEILMIASFVTPATSRRNSHL